jgi:DNA primase
MQIPEIKSRLPIFTVLATYNLKPDKNNLLRCPFHEDKTASLQVYPKTNTYHCFACGATGDQIEFIERYEKCTKHEAIETAKRFANTIKNNYNGEQKAKQLIDKGIGSLSGIEVCLSADKAGRGSGPGADYQSIFTMLRESPRRSPKALEYIKERGLENIEEIAYNSGTLYPKLKNCIIFPLKDKEGNIASLYGRRITESKGYALEYGKHYYSENRSGLYPNYPDPQTKTLIITEAIIDAATLLQISEITPQYTILSAYGTNGLTKEHKAAIAELKQLKEIIFFFDGDQAGIEGALKNAEELQKFLPSITITTVETPQGEDVNSLFVKYGAECLMQLINERKPTNELSFSTETSLIDEHDSPVPPVNFQISSFSNLQIDQPNKIIFESQTARYIVKGSLCKQLDKMLVSLDVQHLETGLKYRTRFDLYEEKQTRKEAREAAEKLDLRSDLIENDLSKLTDLLEEYRDQELQQSKEENNTDTMPDLPTQAKCKAFLQKENLIQNLNELIGKSGIVGEENNRLFLFVIATSHKMPDTLHALIQGSSGSGKTHLLSKIADLMPPERVVKFTRVTENSFYNYDEYFFKGKLICLEDIDGLKEEALFAWRELISNNQLSSSTSQKDENGNIRSAQRIVRGPMASICATTHGQIYEDNMSRLFIIAVDESREQTERIMQYQSKAASGIIEKEEETKAKEFLQNCIRMLRPYKVINPYADKVKLPPQAHKIRRLHELFLAFVKQVTIINQYQRKHDQQGRIITQPEDLQTAVNIMFESIFLKVDELDGSLRQFFEELKAYLEEKPNAQQYEFTQREIRHALHISKTQLHRYLYELIGLEYLQQTGGYANKGFKYRVSYWDNIQKLRNEIQSYLFDQIHNLAFQPVGTLNGTPESAPVQ